MVVGKSKKEQQTPLDSAALNRNFMKPSKIFPYKVLYKDIVFIPPL